MHFVEVGVLKCAGYLGRALIRSLLRRLIVIVDLRLLRSQQLGDLLDAVFGVEVNIGDTPVRLGGLLGFEPVGGGVVSR